MTPSQIETFVRQRHNAVSDTFWSSDEILNLIYAACLEMSREALVIEQLYSTSTVAGTQSYAFPTNTIAIKRVTWNGNKLQPIDQRDDDQLTGGNQATTGQGNPQYYYIWNDTLYLRPIPSSVATLQIFSFNEPAAIASSTSTLEVPSLFHIDMVDYCLSCMSAKEKNFEGAQYWRDQWEKRLVKIKAWQRKRLRADAFSAVKDIESMSQSFIGTV